MQLQEDNPLKERGRERTIIEVYGEDNLRWIETVSSTFQYLEFDGSL